MSTMVKQENRNVWPYVIWPPVILNIGAILLIGGMYAFRYAASAGSTFAVVEIGYGQIQFALSILIIIVEWFFALLLIIRYNKSGASIWGLFSRDGRIFRFRWGPAILLFIAVNAVWIIYILYLSARMPDLSYRDMNPFQISLFLLLMPITAAFTEELIWRGHIITGFELRGKKPRFALVISAASFALIHGVFFPDKVLVTFLLGLIMGFYYQRERSLVPLIITHWLLDLWSFGVFYWL
jgi:membrane protease YdiL (CAAX protease family)